MTTPKEALSDETRQGYIDRLARTVESLSTSKAQVKILRDALGKILKKYPAKRAHGYTYESGKIADRAIRKADKVKDGPSEELKALLELFRLVDKLFSVATNSALFEAHKEKQIEDMRCEYEEIANRQEWGMEG